MVNQAVFTLCGSGDFEPEDARGKLPIIRWMEGVTAPNKQLESALPSGDTKLLDSATQLLLLFCGRASAGLTVFASEAFDASGGVHQLLLASEKRMATRTDFYVNVAAMSRAGIKSVSARAVHAHFVISRMNSWLHGVS
jgi:hypothetical protein